MNASDWLAEAIARAQAEVALKLARDGVAADVRIDLTPLLRPPPPSAQAAAEALAEHVQRMTAELLAQRPPGYRLDSIDTRIEGEHYVVGADWVPE